MFSDAYPLIMLGSKEVYRIKLPTGNTTLCVLCLYIALPLSVSYLLYDSLLFTAPINRIIDSSYPESMW